MFKVIIFLIGSTYGNTIHTQLETIDGFESKQLCEKAAKDIQKKNTGAYSWAKALCIEIRKESK